MFGSWITHHKGIFEDRPVEVQTYSDGGYMVKTTQGKDYEGSEINIESDTVVMPPTPAGMKINIEGETIEEIYEQLAKEGFNRESIEKIVALFPVCR